MKNHQWLKDFNWKELYNKEFPSPFVPNPGDNFDTRFCNSNEKEGMRTKERLFHVLREEKTHKIFADYYYNKLDRAELDRDSIVNPHENLEDKGKYSRVMNSTGGSIHKTHYTSMGYNSDCKDRVSSSDKISHNRTSPLPVYESSLRHLKRVHAEIMSNSTTSRFILKKANEQTKGNE